MEKLHRYPLEGELEKEASSIVTDLQLRLRLCIHKYGIDRILATGIQLSKDEIEDFLADVKVTPDICMTVLVFLSFEAKLKREVVAQIKKREENQYIKK